MTIIIINAVDIHVDNVIISKENRRDCGATVINNVTIDEPAYRLPIMVSHPREMRNETATAGTVHPLIMIDRMNTRREREIANKLRIRK